jgi:hypothetical protein
VWFVEHLKVDTKSLKFYYVAAKKTSCAYNSLINKHL